LDLTDTIKDGARLFFVDEGIRRQLLLALTEDSKLHIEEVCDDNMTLSTSLKVHNLVLENSDLCSLQLVDVYRLVEDQIDIPSVAVEVARGKVLVNLEYDLVQLDLIIFFVSKYHDFSFGPSFFCCYLVLEVFSPYSHLDFCLVYLLSVCMALKNEESNAKCVIFKDGNIDKS